MHLDARGDSDDGNAVLRGGGHIPRGAVPAAEQDQFDPRRDGFFDGAAGVLRGTRLSRDVDYVDSVRWDSRDPERARAHVAPGGDPLEREVRIVLRDTDERGGQARRDPELNDSELVASDRFQVRGIRSEMDPDRGQRESEPEQEGRMGREAQDTIQQGSDEGDAGGISF